MARKPKIVKISDITKFGDSLARSIRARLRWSKKLRGQVKLHKAKENRDITSIEITIAEGNPDLAGMARAFAFGSGLHATRGEREVYKIPPKTKRAIWFPYPQSKVYPGVVTYVNNGVFGITTKMVKNHPGVESKNYIQKSIDSTMAKATEELKVSIRRNLVDELRLAVKEVTKK